MCKMRETFILKKKIYKTLSSKICLRCEKRVFLSKNKKHSVLFHAANSGHKVVVYARNYFSQEGKSTNTKHCIMEQNAVKMHYSKQKRIHVM